MSDVEQNLNEVDAQVTDGVTQASTHVIGLGAALAAVNAFLGQTQAQSVLFANMVNQQQQYAVTGLVATSRSIAKLFGGKKPAAGVSTQQTSMYREETVTQRSAEPEKPVVT
jgi:hypothetical protein